VFVHLDEAAVVVARPDRAVRKGTLGSVVEPVVGSVVGPDAGPASSGRSCPHQGEVRNVGGGKLVVTLTDPDGNVFGLSQEP
jgi:hypothetical protein